MLMTPTVSSRLSRQTWETIYFQHDSLHRRSAGSIFRHSLPPRGLLRGSRPLRLNIIVIEFPKWLAASQPCRMRGGKAGKSWLRRRNWIRWILVINVRLKRIRLWIQISFLDNYAEFIDKKDDPLRDDVSVYKRRFVTWPNVSVKFRFELGEKLICGRWK